MQECIPRPVPAIRYDSTFGTLCIDYITQKYICQVRKNKSPELFFRTELIAVELDLLLVACRVATNIIYIISHNHHIVK